MCFTPVIVSIFTADADSSVVFGHVREVHVSVKETSVVTLRHSQ